MKILIVEDDLEAAAYLSKAFREAGIVSDHASDRFTAQTGYSPVDGTKPSVKDRFRMGRSGTPDPQQKFAHETAMPVWREGR